MTHMPAFDALIGNRRSRRTHGESGAALVELAIVLPLLALILVGTIDFGRVFRTAMIVTAAARAGAQWGSQGVVNFTNTAGMSNAALAVLTANGVVASGSDPAPQASAACWCADTSASPVGGATVACGSVCASPNHIVAYVTVTVTRTFSMINPFPGLPNTVTITRGATARAQ